jgi:acylphosphatase
MTDKAVRAVVHGRVHGVWFRDSTTQRAQALGVSGWVRNLADGSVEVHAEGEPRAVDQLVSFLHDGPPRARVHAVHVERAGLEGGADFRIRG